RGTVTTAGGRRSADARRPSPRKVAMSVCIACRILAMLSVEGQRGRPSDATRLDLLNVVGSSPALRARPEAVRWLRSARRSIAAQMREWESTGPSVRPLRPSGEGDRNKYL